MDRKIKLAAAISLVGLSVAACAPNPYWQYPGTATYNTTNRSTATTTTNSKASVTHSHNGKVHSHPLPASGLSHTHNTGQAGQATTNYNAPPQNNSYYTEPNTYSYNPGAGYSNQYGSSSTGSYYDYSAPKSTTATTTSTSGSYYDYSYTAPTTTTPAYSNSSGNTYMVQKGDTVFQVMRNTGVYWKDIIRLNNLQAPDYTIQPGQTLRLK